MSRKSALLEKLALILSTTEQDSVALAAFRAMRALHPRGALFVVNPIVVLRPKREVDIDRLEDLVFADLDRGLAYSRIAVALRTDHRKVRVLRDRWAAMSEARKQQRREGWAEERRQRRDVLEEARDEANSRYVASFRPRLWDDGEHQDIPTRRRGCGGRRKCRRFAVKSAGGLRRREARQPPETAPACAIPGRALGGSWRAPHGGNRQRPGLSSAAVPGSVSPRPGCQASSSSSTSSPIWLARSSVRLISQ